MFIHRRKPLLNGGNTHAFPWDQVASFSAFFTFWFPEQITEHDGNPDPDPIPKPRPNPGFVRVKFCFCRGIVFRKSLN